MTEIKITKDRIRISQRSREGNTLSNCFHCFHSGHLLPGIAKTFLKKSFKLICLKSDINLSIFVRISQKRYPL